MTRRPSQTGYRQFRTTLLLAGVLWLSGCVSQPAPHDSASSPAQAYTRLGMAYLARDDLPRARSALNHALDLAPRDPEVQHAMALLYQRQGQAPLADSTFRAVLKAAPEFTRARNNYAAFLYDQGRIRDACRQLERAATDLRYDRRAQLLANLERCQLALGAVKERLEQADSNWPQATPDAAQGKPALAERRMTDYRRLTRSDRRPRRPARAIVTRPLDEIPVGRAAQPEPRIPLKDVTP